MLQACWVGCVEKEEEECYKPVGQGIQKKKKNATNLLGWVYRKRRSATNMLSRVYRKRRRMLQTCCVGYIEKEEECYKHGQGIQKKKKNATNMMGRVYRKRRRVLQIRVGYNRKARNCAVLVYRKRRRMLQTCWVGHIEKEEECYKHLE